jgi:hypothetical protein
MYLSTYTSDIVLPDVQRRTQNKAPESFVDEGSGALLWHVKISWVRRDQVRLVAFRI